MCTDLFEPVQLLDQFCFAITSFPDIGFDLQKDDVYYCHVVAMMLGWRLHYNEMISWTGINGVHKAQQSAERIATIARTSTVFFSTSWRQFAAWVSMNTITMMLLYIWARHRG